MQLLSFFVLLTWAFSIFVYSLEVDVRLVAQAINEAILKGDETFLVNLSLAPLNVKGSLVNDIVDIEKIWHNFILNLGKNIPRINKVTILSYNEALKIIGPFPKRYKKVPKDSFVTLILYDNLLIILILKYYKTGWKIILIDYQ